MTNHASHSNYPIRENDSPQARAFVDAPRTSKHTPGPWRAVVRANHTGVTLARVSTDNANGGAWSSDRSTLTEQNAADARLIAAAPELLREAGVLRCLASSPRFQTMTVADALAELANNGCGHDNGAALAKVDA